MTVKVWEHLFPAITANILWHEDMRYRKKREEADIKESLEEEEIEDATADFQEALDTVDKTTGVSKPVSSAIRKESKRAAKKAVQNDKRRMQKNLRAMSRRRPRHQGPKRVVKVHTIIEKERETLRSRNLSIPHQRTQNPTRTGTARTRKRARAKGRRRKAK